ncbi:MAG: DUF2917 domain-containing protein [Anaerolineaceae bacterium]
MEYLITKENGYNVGKKTSNCECVDINLDQGEVFTLLGDQRGSIIQNLRGVVWITQENDADDYKIFKGEEFTISKSGKVIVQGVPTARIRITAAEDAAAEGLEESEAVQTIR